MWGRKESDTTERLNRTELMREGTSKIGLSMVAWQDGAATEWGKRVVEFH